MRFGGLALASLAVLCACQDSTTHDVGDGEDEFNAGANLDAKGDYIEAMRWYRKAADKGDADAMFNIGVLYDNGEGVKQDYIEAMRWYRKAADKGDADAKAALKRLRDK